MSINHNRLNVNKPARLTTSNEIAQNLQNRWDNFKKTYILDEEFLTADIDDTPADIDLSSVTDNLYSNLNNMLVDIASGNFSEADDHDKLERTLLDLQRMAMYDPAEHRYHLPQLIDLMKIGNAKQITYQHERMILQNFSIRIIGFIANEDPGYIRKTLPELIRIFFNNLALEDRHPFSKNLPLMKSLVNNIIFRGAVSNPQYIIPTILEYTRSKNFEVRKISNEYMVQLTKMPQKVMASLIACLMRSDENLRSNAVQALGRLGLNKDLDRAAVIPYLLNSVNDPSWPVQIEARAALESLEISTDKYKLAAGSVRKVRELMKDLKSSGLNLQSKEKLVHNLYKLMNQGKFERVIVIANLNMNELSNLKHNRTNLSGSGLNLTGAGSDVAGIYEKDSGLRIEYNFDEFRVGPQNFFAHSAAFAVAANPMVIFNPLYIYGSPSSGKTHLLNAVGNFTLYNNPNSGVMYWDAGEFFNDFLTARETGQLAIFRELQSKTSMLLIDDIHQFQGNSVAQAELLFAFDEIYHNKGKILITSDRPPKELGGFDKRLVTRMAMGVVTGIGRVNKKL